MNLTVLLNCSLRSVHQIDQLEIRLEGPQKLNSVEFHYSSLSLVSAIVG